ncbi:beta-1,3-galactosyltransferase 5-like [Saccostrea cucullata]|uniref:beta-1,3-galactosyltransferase 5-like n=1 Tax=Saccostrea cuccullata TaxID=36930 RepID=UPI002ED677C3
MKVCQYFTRLKGRKPLLVVCVFICVVLINKILNRFVYCNEGKKVKSYRLVQAYVDNGLFQFKSTQPLCQDPQKTPLNLLVMISSRPTHFDRRTALRESWISLLSSDKRIRHFFIIGRSKTAFYNEIANTEGNIFNDIIQMDMEDTDENETNKSIAMLGWVHKNCAKVQYVLKINDDVFLNIHLLIKDLQHTHKKNAVIGCRVDDSKTILNSVFRLVSFAQFDRSKQPVYVKSSAYLITGDIISKMYMATHHVSNITTEDKYITGLCREYIKAEAVGHPGFSCGYRDKGPCGSNFRYAITGNHYYPDELVRMWKELNNRWSDCRLIDNYWVSYAFDVVN